MLWQQLANGISIGSVYALISLGLTMVYGILRILHVAHAGIYALGLMLVCSLLSSSAISGSL
jgi:branched-chain amino acid transport system permease protein